MPIGRSSRIYLRLSPLLYPHFGSARLYSLVCDIHSRFNRLYPTSPPLLGSHFVSARLYSLLCDVHSRFSRLSPTSPPLLCSHFVSARLYSLLCDVHSRFSWLSPTSPPLLCTTFWFSSALFPPQLGFILSLVMPYLFAHFCSAGLYSPICNAQVLVQLGFIPSFIMPLLASFTGLYYHNGFRGRLYSTSVYAYSRLSLLFPLFLYPHSVPPGFIPTFLLVQ